MDERSTRVSVVLASDVRLYREGLGQMLENAAWVEVVASVSDAGAALRETRKLRPGVMLLDMAMKDSFLAAREVAGLDPPTRIVAFGLAENEPEVIACAQLGVSGYVLREASMSDALDAIRAAARGEVSCSPKIVRLLLQHIAAQRRASREPTDSLTLRESQVLHLLQEGLSNKMISRHLGIELQTVKNHVHNILAKLSVHRRGDAVSLLRNKECTEQGGEEGSPPATVRRR